MPGPISDATLAWAVALGGIGLGGMAALIPGFPGAAVALLGVVAFAAITDWQIVNGPALLLCGLVALASAVAQVAAPAVTSRALGGTAGAATGAALGAMIGAFVPIPGAPLFGGILGSIALGALGAREGVLKSLRGVIGAAGGCAWAVAVDLLAVLAIASILAIAAFRAT